MKEKQVCGSKWADSLLYSRECETIVCVTSEASHILIKRQHKDPCGLISKLSRKSLSSLFFTL